ncbi:WD40-repeat-containing subunit of the 18S rRNA processing complex [Fasciola gigantica]|uniref:WD40-repeat-containing subunit of the 18S rRNA processing complex n=1 Tax=Fasciola gigantica TaxID=46835 RepID=A0A504Z0P8_FASGI|nr:WD40-repeat-containing subunit of the 18S rRNA processing complex [Fasciola gigantica]
MRLNFRFSNLFGTAYKKGNVIFTSNGSGLLSPVGNQITVFDLKRDVSTTLEIRSFHDITHIAISPSLAMLIAINEIGEASLVSLISGAVISVYPLRHPVTVASFSPDGKFVAISKGHCVILFHAPCDKRLFNHLEIYRVCYGFTDDVTSIDWTSDSKVFAAGCADNTCRIFSVHKLKNLVVYGLSMHKNPIIGAFFYKDSMDLLSVSSDGEVCSWEATVRLEDLEAASQNDQEKVLFKLMKRHRHIPTTETGAQALITAVAFHKTLRLLVSGFDSGILMLHTMPEFTVISEVKLFNRPVTTLSVNISGSWIAAGSDEHGQLTVWEWRSQACYLKAESHARHMTSLAYSPDGLHLATGGHDAKVKVWRVASGRTLVTFSDHTAAVTGVAFPASKAKVVVSASLDGTVRAHDLVRYRNFRTFTVPTRQVQFASLAVDGPGSLVAAGSLDTFEAFIWSMQTGILLTILSGHTAPISAITFNPDISGYALEMASVSWDKTLRLWNLTGNTADEHNPSSLGNVKEVVNFAHDVLCVAYRGDGKELALALLNGDIVFYDPIEGTEKGAISGQRDLGVSQTTEQDLVTPKRSAQAKRFQTIAYSADGEHLLAAGDSKYICLYSVPDRALLKRFEVTCNMSLGGVQEVHDRRRFLATYGSDAVQARTLEKTSLPIPASRHGEDRSSRQWRPDIRVSSIQFSPTGDAFAATTTEGVLVYSLASAGSGFGVSSHFGYSQDQPGTWLFESVGLDEQCTPQNARAALADARYGEALDIIVRLRLHDVAEEVLEGIPSDQIDYLARQCPVHQVAQFLFPFIARQLGGRSRHVEFYIHWADALLRAHALALRRSAAVWALASTKSAEQLALEKLNKDPELQTPGLLIERGEWAACQANLIRLQTGLNRVKTNVIQRYESVDNLWHYLESVVNLKCAAMMDQNHDERSNAETSSIVVRIPDLAPSEQNSDDLIQNEADQTVPHTLPKMADKKKKKKTKQGASENEAKKPETNGVKKSRNSIKHTVKKETKCGARKSRDQGAIRTQ